MDFLSIERNLSSQYGKQLSGTATNTGLDARKAASKKVAHKAARATGEFIGSKIADKIVKPKPLLDENSRDVKEIVTPPYKKEKILSELRQVL